MQTAQLSQSSLDEIISIIERNQSKCSNLKQNISLSLNYENELSRLTTQFLYDLSYDLRTILAALDRSRTTNISLNNQLQCSERKIAELNMKCQNYQRQIFELESALCELNRKITELTSVNQNNQNYIEELLIKLRLNSDRKNYSFYEGTDYLSKNKSMISTTYEFEDFTNSSIRKNPSLYNLKKLNFDYDLNDNFNYNYKLGNSYYNEGRNTLSDGRVNANFRNFYDKNSFNNEGLDRNQSNSNREYTSVFSGRKLNEDPNQNFDNSYKINNFDKSPNNQPNYQNNQQNYDNTNQKYYKSQNNLTDNTQYIKATVNPSQRTELNVIQGNDQQINAQNTNKINNNMVNNNFNNQQNINNVQNESNFNNQEKQNNNLINNDNINSVNITENESSYNNNSFKNSNKTAYTNFKNDVINSIKKQYDPQSQEISNNEAFYQTNVVNNSSYQTPLEKQGNQSIQTKKQNTLLQNKITDNNQFEQPQISVNEARQYENKKEQLQPKGANYGNNIQSQTQKIYENYQNQKNSKNDIKETNQSAHEEPRLSKEKIKRVQKIVMEAFKDEETVNQLREKLGDDFEDKLTKGDINEEYLDKIDEALNEIKHNQKQSPQKISKRLQIAQGAHTKKKIKDPMKDQMYYKTQLKKAITDKQCHYKEYPRGWNSSKDYFVNNNSSDGRIEKSPMKIPNVPK